MARRLLPARCAPTPAAHLDRRHARAVSSHERPCRTDEPVGRPSMTLTARPPSAPVLDADAAAGHDRYAGARRRPRTGWMPRSTRWRPRWRERGVALRPHAKTHKSLEVGRRQLAAGAAGLTVAHDRRGGGLRRWRPRRPVHRLSAVARDRKAERLRALARSATPPVGRHRFRRSARERVAAAARARRRDAVRVLVEVDVGRRAQRACRPAEAGALGAEAAGAWSARSIGVFTHGGHGYARPTRRDGRGRRRGRGARRGRGRRCAAAGIEPPVVSAGSTPTALGVGARRGDRGAARARTCSAIASRRPSAAIGPRCDRGGHGRDRSSSVDAGERRFVVDAGAKILGKDVAPYLAGHGEIPGLGGAVVARVYDHHGIVDVPTAGAAAGGRAGRLGRPEPHLPGRQPRRRVRRRAGRPARRTAGRSTPAGATAESGRPTAGRQRVGAASASMPTAARIGGDAVGRERPGAQDPAGRPR